MTERSERPAIYLNLAAPFLALLKRLLTRKEKLK